MNDNKDNSQRPPAAFKPIFMWIFLFAGIIIFIAMQQSGGFGTGVEELTYSQLVERIQNDKIKTMALDKKSGMVQGELITRGEIKPKFKTYSSSVDREVLEKLTILAGEHGVDISFKEPSRLMAILEYLFPMLLILLIFYFLVFRQIRGGGSGGILSFGKSRAVRITRDKSHKTFDDVAGVDEAREEIKEIIEFLKGPERFQRLGGRLPKGVLLIGPPGTGKTLLAKAIAGEADVPFFSISGSDFVEMFVGVGASRVRDLFEQAKGSSPCIIFLDEIDAVGRKRANDLPGSGVETAQTLNAILVEMDGFTSDESVIVIAATNRPDVLDPALLRPGRFDRRIYVDLPDIRGREAILKVHCKGVKINEEVDLSIIARGTPTFSGADLENLVNEAALIAVMKNLQSVTMDCFEEARDKVRFGKERRSRKMDDEDRRATALHEAGHALLMRLMPHVTPLHKVTIIPRGRALGATMQLPTKDEYNMGKKKILGEIAVRLGGRAAEELFLDDVTNGASNDFEQASGLARSMVREWGMSDAIGMISYPIPDEGALIASRDYSEATAEKIDVEVRRIVDEAYDEAKRLLTANSDDVMMLVEALMEFELLSAEEVEKVLSERTLDGVRDVRKANADKNGYVEGKAEDGETSKASDADKNKKSENAAYSKTPYSGDEKPEADA